jgi:putative membrane protein
MATHHHVPHGSWECPVWFTVAVVLAGLGYVRGWLQLRSTSPGLIPAWRAVSFVAGLSSIWVAVASPFAVCDDQRLLTGHMVQHLLLLSLAPPLVLLGSPLLALSYGLPPEIARALGAVFRRPRVQRIGKVPGQPALGWLAATVVLVVWHVPGALTLGLRSEAWHAVEHASFLATGLLFWWPVIQPWPSAPTGPQWWMVVYLFLATLPCDIMAGFLVFSERVLYPVYLSTPGQPGLSALDDQQLAGALMWTGVTIIYLVAGTVISARLLSTPSVDEDRLAVAEPA